MMTPQTRVNLTHSPTEPRKTPWASWMKWGLGAMRIPRKEFWALSLKEWSAALRGYQESKGITSSDAEHMSSNELDKLMELYPD